MSGPSTPEPMPDRTRERQVDVFDYVFSDIKARRDYGRVEYGGPLVTNDGRNSLWDAYQEALDLAVYLRKAIIEQTQKEVENG